MQDHLQKVDLPRLLCLHYYNCAVVVVVDWSSVT